MRAALRPSSRCSVTALVAVVALGLAACSGSASPTNPPVSAAVASEGSAAPSAASPTQTGSMSPAPTDSGGTASAPTSGPTAVPTALDPCQLITSQEAGRLASTSFGAGKEEKLSGNSKMCTYGYQTKNVFEVIVAVAPDVATAKKQEASAEADLQANAAKLNQGLTITKLPGFTSDSDAVLLELKPNSIGVSGRAIYVLRGTVFFGFSDLVLLGSAPSADAMKAEAMTVLGRLP